MPHAVPQPSSGSGSEHEVVPPDPALGPCKVCATISSVQSMFGAQWFALGSSVDPLGRGTA